MTDNASEQTVRWPAGWSRERLVHASGDEIGTLSAEDSDQMFDSLRTALGPDGFISLVQEIGRNETAREQQTRLDSGKSADPLDDLMPQQRLPVLDILNGSYPAGPWGWVVYRTCSYADEATWKTLRERFDAVIAQQFEPHMTVPEIKAAADRFKIHWVDEPRLESATVDQVAAEYRNLRQTGILPEGLAHQMCLKIGQQELQAIIESPLPTPNPVHQQLIIPYATAVDMSAGEDPEMDAWHWEEHGHYTSFQVALEALTGDLFIILMKTIRSPREVSVGLAGDKVYLSYTGRLGVFTLGVSQGDEAFSRR